MTWSGILAWKIEITRTAKKDLPRIDKHGVKLSKAQLINFIM